MQTNAPSPLSDNDKDRIRSEEIFRSEVRAELDRPSKGGRVWKALNSAFTLWFLSSVLLAILSAKIAGYQKQRELDEQRDTLQKRLTTELQGRILMALASLQAEKQRADAGRFSHKNVMYSQVTQYLDNRYWNDPTWHRDFSTFPEFRERPFRSLVVQLQLSLASTNPEAARRALRMFDELLLLSSIDPGNEDPPTRADTDAAILDSTKKLEALEADPFLTPRK